MNFPSPSDGDCVGVGVDNTGSDDAEVVKAERLTASGV